MAFNANNLASDVKCSYAQIMTAFEYNQSLLKVLSKLVMFYACIITTLIQYGILSFMSITNLIACTNLFTVALNMKKV